ncbi:hypothetical protein AB0C27_07950 [Nonomuraea sp. NPDC048882]|uniref:hypothetical protein n=1 Tax=Nonomuraea sp. NPDC048882 TaxID=3154347 RepID=UPI003405535D
MKLQLDDVVCETCGSSDTEVTCVGLSRFARDVLRVDYFCRTCEDRWNVWL